MQHVVYTQINNKMVMLRPPKGNPNNPNFVITWQGRDWSGFRTLDECRSQFHELEARDGNNFEVVEY